MKMCWMHPIILYNNCCEKIDKVTIFKNLQTAAVLFLIYEFQRDKGINEQVYEAHQWKAQTSYHKVAILGKWKQRHMLSGKQAKTKI